VRADNRRVLRGRLTYANVVATICLFIVLGGGAYAATQLPANSVGTKQIKDRAVTGEKLSRSVLREIAKVIKRYGPRPPYAIGPAGPQGPRGATGPQGPAGKNAAFGEVIPSGTTVFGAWNIFDPFDPPGVPVQETVALPGRTPEPLTDSKVNFGPESEGIAGDSDENCTGSAVSPTAPPGKVCVYSNYGQTSPHALEGTALRIGGPSEPVSLVAFSIKTGTAENNGLAGGTWAYTAP
jgi:hypothetical protein